MASNYKESDIKVFSGLSGIRQKPTMYIGSVEAAGLATLLREPTDNAFDEHGAGRNTGVTIVQDGNGAWVIDKGEGIPVGIITDKGTGATASALHFVVSSHHAGGKFDGKAYTASGGTHGIGLKAVNALSKAFEVWTCRDRQWWYTRWERGVCKTEVCQSPPPKIPNHPRLRIKGGTVIHYEPDTKIFGKSTLDLASVVKWLHISSFMHAGMNIKWIPDSGEPQEWQSEGISDYMDWLISDMELESELPFRLTTKNLDIAIAPTNHLSSHVVAYTNGIANGDGGVHLDLLWRVLAKTLGATAARAKVGVADVRDIGFVGVMQVYVQAPQFSSQTKEKLTDQRIPELIEAPLTDALTRFWATKDGKAQARRLIERIKGLRDAKAQLADTKRQLAALKSKSKGKALLPGKLAAVKCDPSERELYIVEGDSAGGTAKVARVSKPYLFQEILPLKGKIFNAEKTKQARLFASEEIQAILVAIGYDAANEVDPLHKLRVARIIFLADSDVDGQHITALLITLLKIVAPTLFARGVVYVVKSPRYYLRDTKGRFFFGTTIEDISKQVGSKVTSANYLKGWGEIDAAPLREVAFGPKRELLKLSEMTGKDMAVISLLMGDSVQGRKELLGVE